MMEEIRLSLRPLSQTEWKGSKDQRSWEQAADDATRFAACCTAYFFMTRPGEIVNSGGVDTERVLRGCDIVLLGADGKTSKTNPERVDLTFRKTKTDQEAFGATRTHYRSGKPICPVMAIEHLLGWFPQRAEGGREAMLPLFRWANSHVLTRAHLQEPLQQAARAVGLPPDRLTAHSYRIGGASALYNATGEIETVKRYGRWTSGAFHRYLWDSAEQAKGVAAKMSVGHATVHR
jgi:hypothetical protein